MPDPAASFNVPSHGRHYKTDAGNLPSVTNVIGTLDKPALVPWAAKMAATRAIERRHIWLPMLEDGETEEALDYLKRNWRTKRDNAADQGTSVHEALEHWLDTGGEKLEVALSQEPYFKAGRDWWNQMVAVNGAELVATEASLVNLDADHAYAGTVDLVATFAGQVIFADWKTGSGLYREAAMQLVALMRCTHLLAADGTLTPVTWDAPAQGYGVHLKPSGQWDKKIIDSDDQRARHLFDAFQGLAKAKRALQEIHRREWSVS
jgi:hypothetical protein